MSWLSRAVGAVQLAAKAHAPTILVAGGVVSMGAGAVIACKKTLKVEEVLTKHSVSLERIKEGESLELSNYNEEDARGDRFKVYSRAGFDLAKLYAFPGILFAGGACLVVGGHKMLLQRNATLALAFTAVTEAFAKYRARVVEEQGSEADQRFLHGYVVKEVYDDGTGKTHMITTRDWEGDPNGDPYNRVFEQGASSQWEPDLGINKMFIGMQERFANELLARRGYLWLSEVYTSLGFPENDTSRVVGWKVRTLPDGSRDIPFVSFGLDKPHPDDWKYSKEHAIYLDFNCQGLIVGGKIQKILERA